MNTFQQYKNVARRPTYNFTLGHNICYTWQKNICNSLVWPLARRTSRICENQCPKDCWCATHMATKRQDWPVEDLGCLLLNASTWWMIPGHDSTPFVAGCNSRRMGISRPTTTIYGNMVRSWLRWMKHRPIMKIMEDRMYHSGRETGQ